MEQEAAESNSTILVDKVIDRRELVGLGRTRMLHSARFWVYAALGILFGGGSIYLAVLVLKSSDGSVWGALVLLGVGLFFLIRFGLLFAWGPWWGTRRALKRVEPETIEFSESGVRIRAQPWDVASPWENFSHTTELGPFYVLKRSKPRGLIHVSRQGFHSNEDEERFRQLVSRKTIAQLAPDVPA